MSSSYLGCDLGAESGRLMLGVLEGGRIQLQEIHRFPNTPIRVGESLCWNMPELFQQLKIGLRKAGKQHSKIQSISCDAWGVDYFLIDDQGEVISPTYHYRDERSSRGVEVIHRKVPREDLFSMTGIQFMPFNSVYQLGAESSVRLSNAYGFLPIADGFNYLLCGRQVVEQSSASTTALYDPRTHQWSDALLKKLEFDPSIFPRIVPSGTALAQLKPEICRECDIDPITVTAACSHDTAAAVAAVPSAGDNWAYISSGTWSLMGVEVAAPVINDRCRELNYTNEVGVGQTIRLLKNIIGLWMVQECRREWENEGRAYDYSELTTLAGNAPPFVSLVDPTDPRFIAPGDVPGKIRAFCRELGQPEPEGPGPMIRCILESLALLYRKNLLQIQELIQSSIDRLHIVGGGSRNHLLNQFTADALGISVIAGPAEGTALGNILIQAVAAGKLGSLAEARKVVGASIEVVVFNPQNPKAWTEAYGRFLSFSKDKSS
jgi:rhamnulokinase